MAAVAVARAAMAATVIVDPAVKAATVATVVPRGEGRGDRGDRGPRREREGGNDEGPAPEFAPAFLNRDDD